MMLRSIFIFLFTFCVVGCATTSRSTNDVDGPSMSRVADGLVRDINEVIGNHPSLHFKNIQLLQKKTGLPSAIGSELIEKISSALTSTNPYEINWISGNNKMSTCVGYVADYYLEFRINEDEKVSWSLLSGKDQRPLTPSVGAVSTHFLSPMEYKWSKTNVEYIKAPQVFTLDQTKMLADHMAEQFACKYRYSKYSDIVLRIETESESLTPLALMLRRALHEALPAVQNHSVSKSDVIITLNLIKDSHSNTGKVVALVNDAKGNLLPALESIIDVYVSGEPENRPLIEYFHGVVPVEDMLCYQPNSWQFGERILPKDVVLSHGGCLAIKGKLTQPATYFLLLETSEGHLLKLHPDNCHPSVPNATEVMFPPHYAERQLVIQLNHVAGVETFGLIATSGNVSTAMRSMLESIPSLCDTSPKGKNLSLEQVLSAAQKEAYDISKIRVRHYSEKK